MENNIDSKVINSNSKRKKHKFFRTLLNFLTFVVLIIVSISTFISIKGYSDFKNGEEPKFYIDKRIETNGDEKTTVYDFGLYRAEKFENSKKYTYKLTPFFLK